MGGFAGTGSLASAINQSGQILVYAYDPLERMLPGGAPRRIVALYPQR